MYIRWRVRYEWVELDKPRRCSLCRQPLSGRVVKRVFRGGRRFLCLDCAVEHLREDERYFAILGQSRIYAPRELIVKAGLEESGLLTSYETIKAVIRRLRG